MLPEHKPRGATLAKGASIGALLLAVGVAGSVLAGTGTYHTAGVAALTLRNKLVTGRSYSASVIISHKEAVDVSVAISSSNLAAPSSVTVPAGNTSARFTVTAGSPGAASLTASLNSTSRTKNVDVSATKVKDVAIAPSQVVGGGQRARGSVLLASIAGSSTTVNLSSDDPRLAVPASVGVNAGNSRSSYFSVTAPNGVDNPVTANVTADTGGAGTSAPVTILPASIRFAKLGNEGVVVGGKQLVVVVELNGKAGPSGKSYSILSDNPAVVPDGTLVVAAGATRGSVRLSTSDVAVQTNVNLTIPGVPAMGVTVKP